MNTDQLRIALHELNGERDLSVCFAHVHADLSGVGCFLKVKNAMLIPDEQDHLVKVTDGRAVYILDAERVAWIKIG
ncbi:MAG: hypothetical protein KF684_05685 [Phycisphaeraceae bacterium]|nr:hypothetical protein [Phycisphaeraceae bacterium]